jgi:hypothetical protein
MRRYGFRNDQWERIKDLLPGREGHVGGADQAIGRLRGGLTTKIHAICDAMGNPVEIDITPGQAETSGTSTKSFRRDAIRKRRDGC